MSDKTVDWAARPVSLKELARRLALSPTTVSLVLNHAPAASSIPKATRDRVIEAARSVGYRPNHVARSLRSKKSCLLGVVAPELSEGYSALVLAGIEDALLGAGYAYLVTSHRHRPELLALRLSLLEDRQVEGLVLIDTPLDREPNCPVVSVSGHGRFPGVANIVLDHDRAADLALGHLAGLGHRSIAVIRGQAFSSDSEPRWLAIERAAERLGAPIHHALTAQLEGDSPSPEPGYRAAKEILRAGRPFTALFSFNDISAIGAIRALRESGLEVPRQVSVVGFDDVRGAAYHIPALTTIRQPLWEMGKLAAETVLARLATGAATEPAGALLVQPELIVRESTAACPDPERP